MPQTQGAGVRSNPPWEDLPDETLALVPHLPALAEEIVEAIRREVPDSAERLQGPLGEAVRGYVEQALFQFAEMATNPGTGRARGRGVYVALGREEARQGGSLERLLAAYRVGARVAWRRLAEVGLEAGFAPETLVLLAESIFAYIDELSAESAEGFAAEQAARAGEAERRRRTLIELLIAQPPPDPAAAEAAAELAGWRLPRRLAVLTWPEELGQRPARGLPLGTIAAPLDGLVCALVPDADAPGRPEEVLRALRGHPAGVGSVVVPSAATRSFGRARAAMGLALTGERPDPGPVVADIHRAELLLRADPSLVEELAAERLAPLAEETPLSRERLAGTLLAWLRHAGNVPAAAEELVVHPQTVRYRLGRLRELFGEALDDPDARFELELVLRGRSVAAAGG